MNKEEPKLNQDAVDLHEKLFKEDKQKAVEENSNRPVKELVRDAEAMIAKGETYKILIKLNSQVDISGVPLEITSIKRKHITLMAKPGYEFIKDTPANRAQVGYVKPGYEFIDEKEIEKEDEKA